MTEKSIQQVLMLDLYDKGCKYLCPNFWLGYGEADLIAINPSEFIIEYEIKLSRSDFKADRKKVNKHKAYMGVHSYNKPKTWGVPNRFYYVCPEDLLKPEDMFAYSGLIYITPTGPKVITKAPLIHSIKQSQSLIPKIANALTIKFVYGNTNYWDGKQAKVNLQSNLHINDAQKFFEKDLE